MRGAVAVTSTPDAFRITQGEDKLATYRFNTKAAEHHFCSVCGIYTHHKRRSNPNQLGVNVACLEGVSPFDFARSSSTMVTATLATMPSIKPIRRACSGSSLRPTRDLAKRRRPRRGSAVKLRLRLDLRPKLVALFVDAGDHRPHRHAEVDQRRLRQLKRGLQRLRDRIGRARPVELARHAPVSRARATIGSPGNALRK